MKHNTSLNKNGQVSAYDFDEQSLWDDYFMPNDILKQRIENYRKTSMEDLKSRSWNYFEDNRGTIPGDLFAPAKMSGGSKDV